MSELWLPVVIGLLGGSASLVPALLGRMERRESGKRSTQRSTQRPTQPTVDLPAGSMTLRIARYLLSTKEYARIVLPAASGMQRECHDASGHGVSSRQIWFRCALAFFRIIALWGATPMTLATAAGGMVFGLIIADTWGTFAGLVFGLLIGVFRQHEIELSRTRR